MHFALICAEGEIPANDFAASLFCGTQEHLAEIDRKIEEHAKGWKLERISRMSLSILRLCTYELMFTDVPRPVALNEAVELAKDSKAKIIDTSTAHRVSEGWTYGFPELKGQREKIKNSTRIANPGCHASGFIALVAPLTQNGLIGKDAQLTCFSLTGYSGGGKKMIAEYEEGGAPVSGLMAGGRQYALGQQHKHLKEMAHLCGLENMPVFCPIVGDFYSGMEVTVSLFAKDVNGSIEDIRKLYADYYTDGLVFVDDSEDDEEDEKEAENEERKDGKRKATVVDSDNEVQKDAEADNSSDDLTDVESIDEHKKNLLDKRIDEKNENEFDREEFDNQEAQTDNDKERLVDLQEKEIVFRSAEELNREEIDTYEIKKENNGFDKISESSEDKFAENTAYNKAVDSPPLPEFYVEDVIIEAGEVVGELINNILTNEVKMENNNSESIVNNNENTFGAKDAVINNLPVSRINTYAMYGNTLTRVVNISNGINKILYPGCNVVILLETMAGKGSEIGRSFEPTTNVNPIAKTLRIIDAIKISLK